MICTPSTARRPQHHAIGLSYTLSREGKFGDAATQLHEILTAVEKTHGPDHIDTQIARQNYERMLKAAEWMAGFARLYREGLGRTTASPFRS